MVQLITKSQKSLQPVHWTVLFIVLLVSIFMLYQHPLAAQNSSDDGTKSGARGGDDNSPKTTTVSVILGRGNAFSKPYGFYLNPILEHVHANPDQRVKITAILASYKGRLEPLRTEYKQKNQDLLKKLSTGDKPEIIMDEQSHLGRLYSEITLSYCQMSLEVRKVLEPDQIILYEEFKRRQGWKGAAGSSAPAAASPNH